MYWRGHTEILVKNNFILIKTDYINKNDDWLAERIIYYNDKGYNIKIQFFGAKQIIEYSRLD